MFHDMNESPHIEVVETTYDHQVSGLPPSVLFRPISLIHPDTSRYLGPSRPYPDFISLMCPFNQWTEKLDTVNRYVSRYFADNHLPHHRIP